MTLEVPGAIADLGPWFHNLHLPDGRQTAPEHPLGDFPAFKWRQIERCLPANLAGARALDVGCNAGYDSFQLAARGAEVLGLDLDEHYLDQGRWAAEHLDPAGRVEFRQGSVYDLAAIEERFDVVLFMGVLYHLRYPLLALDLVAEKVGGTLVLQTLTLPGERAIAAPGDVEIGDRRQLLEPGWPRAAFVEHELAGDPTNWWVPDAACVEAMARSAGLRVTERPGHEIWVCAAEDEHDHARELRTMELRAATATRRRSYSSQRK
ncbi:MAG TPA: TIGR04290 family methyltransferase [Solirubrobacterales bacterium]|nr:TIGR04290 family methyltransferase [Solirubrobacterales bacterium]